jgi:sirohydrochlorin ferrochelatase
VAGIRLVDREHEQLHGRHRQVDVDGEPDHLVAQPAVLELVEQRLRLGDERPRVDRRLLLDCGRQLGRAEVGVDDSFDVAAEAVAQSRR